MRNRWLAWLPIALCLLGAKAPPCDFDLDEPESHARFVRLADHLALERHLLPADALRFILEAKDPQNPADFFERGGETEHYAWHEAFASAMEEPNFDWPKVRSILRRHLADVAQMEQTRAEARVETSYLAVPRQVAELAPNTRTRYFTQLTELERDGKRFIAMPLPHAMLTVDLDAFGNPSLIPIPPKLSYVGPMIYFERKGEPFALNDGRVLNLTTGRSTPAWGGSGQVEGGAIADFGGRQLAYAHVGRELRVASIDGKAKVDVAIKIGTGGTRPGSGVIGGRRVVGCVGPKAETLYVVDPISGETQSIALPKGLESPAPPIFYEVDGAPHALIATEKRFVMIDLQREKSVGNIPTQINHASTRRAEFYEGWGRPYVAMRTERGIEILDLTQKKRLAIVQSDWGPSNLAHVEFRGEHYLVWSSKPGEVTLARATGEVIVTQKVTKSTINHLHPFVKDENLYVVAAGEGPVSLIEMFQRPSQ